MQSGTPQGDPRLQKTNLGPEIAIGCMDPCIISMETTLPGEIPMLVHLWAASCREVRPPGGLPSWELTDVVILKCFYRERHLLRILEWGFRIQREKSIIVAHPGTAASTRFSDFSSLFDHIPARIYQWHIRYLDCATDRVLRQAATWHPDRPERLAPILLTHSGVDWPSVTQAASAAAGANVAAAGRRARTSRQSVIRRLLSSVFKKKKPKLAHA